MITSYYSANEIEEIEAVAQRAGISPGGLQHEATTLFLEELRKKEGAVADEVDNAEQMEKSKVALENIAKMIQEEQPQPTP